MGGKVLEIINRKVNLEKGFAELTMLDTDFENFTLLIGDDPNYPTPSNINNLNYLVPSSIVSKQLLNDMRNLQVNIKSFDPLNIDDTIQATNDEIFRAGSRIVKSNFDFIQDINASWYSTTNPAIHEVGQAAEYEVLKQYAENVKSLYGFTIEHQNYLNDTQSQLKEWSKNQDYTSSVDTYFFNFSNTPIWNSINITTNEYNYNVTILDDNGNFTVSDLQNTPVGQTGRVAIRFIYTSGSSGALDIFVTVEFTNTGIDNDGLFSFELIAGEFYGSGYITYNVNSATHFDIATPTLAWLQGRVYADDV